MEPAFITQVSIPTRSQCSLLNSKEICSLRRRQNDSVVPASARKFILEPRTAASPELSSLPVFCSSAQTPSTSTNSLSTTRRRFIFSVTSGLLALNSAPPSQAAKNEGGFITEELLDEYLAVLREAKDGLESLASEVSDARWDTSRAMLRVPPLGSLRRAMFKVVYVVPEDNGARGEAKALYTDTMKNIEQLDSVCRQLTRGEGDRAALQVKAASYLASVRSDFDKFVAQLPPSLSV